MEVLETIRTRRSIRKYQRAPVPEEYIDKILEAGQWSPSWVNTQPWSFIVLRDEGILKEVASVTTYGKFLADAPLGIAVVIDPKVSKHPVEDGTIATYSMILTAHSLGLGTCWIVQYETDHEVKVKELLGIPEDKRLLSIISIGLPDESQKSERKEVGEIVFTDRFGKK